ncbi:MAG TPA: FISUMP domain-containing protein, partial [Tenuifilaceae bacterium]|nr:FISUMP domain-containing protein [Tenuifilaceae bacterium]
GDYQYKYFINEGWSPGDPVGDRYISIIDNIIFDDTWDYSPATHGYPVILSKEPSDLDVELYGSGNRLQDESVQIRTGAAFGYEFSEWTGIVDDVSLLDNPFSSTANFTMPFREVAFTANFTASAGYDLSFTVTNETPSPLDAVEVNLRYRGAGGKSKSDLVNRGNAGFQLSTDLIDYDVNSSFETKSESTLEQPLVFDKNGMVVDAVPDKSVVRSDSKSSKSCSFNYDLFVGAVRIITDSNEEIISSVDYLSGPPTDYGFDMPEGGTTENLFGLVVYDMLIPGTQTKVWVNNDFSWLYVPNQVILDNYESYGPVYLENTYNEYVDFCGYEFSFNTTPTVSAGHFGDHNFRILPYGLCSIYTDASGLASLNTEGGNYFYSIKKAGYQTQTGTTTLSASNNIPVTLVQIFEGGIGTIDDPFLVSSAEQLNSVRDYIGHDYAELYFKQTVDINLGVSPWIDVDGWEPIGSQNYPFAAHYDGGSYSISGLTINRPTQREVGLFGWASGATLKNISLINVNIAADWRIGALVGHIDGSGVIDSVSCSGSITGSTHVGGLAGRVWESSVSNSYSLVDVTQIPGVSTTTQQAAGLVGRMYTGSIENCFATGNVSGAPSGYWNGGLVGINSAGSHIVNSYSTGSVNGSQYVGGLVGATTDSSSIVNCYTVSYIPDSINSGGLVGGVYDEIYVVNNSYWNVETSCQAESPVGEGKSTLEMIAQSTYSGWDFATIWNINEGVTYPYLRLQSEIGTFNYPIELIPPTNFMAVAGSGSISLSWNAPSLGAPTGYKIYRDGSLVYTASNAELSYNDVGLTNFVYYTYYVTAVYAGGESNPTVSQTTFPNTGFDGGDGSELNPFVISNADQLHTVRLYPSSHFLQVADIDLGVSPWNENEGWDPIGNDEELFTGTYYGGGYSVSNLTINRPDGVRIGLFGNAENAMFSNIHLENVDIVGLSQLGSLVGHAYTCTIDTCSASGSINAEGSTIGGIAGFIGEFSSLTQSYSDVKIIAKYNSVGGLVGVSLNSSIADSYSAGYIGADGYIGGLVGYCQDQASVTNCYSVGFVAGVNEVGGLVGSADAPELIVNGFWDIPSSGQYDSPAGTGLFTNDMLLQSNFTGWDFSTIWSINEGVTYPYLQWQVSAGAHNNPTDNYSDIDGNTYSTIVIGEQEWFAENLKVTRFQNGTSILNGQELGEVLTDTTYYFAYDNNPDNIATYGLLYSGYVATDILYNVCPAGWAVPTNEQWKVMEMQLGMSWEETNNWGISNGHGTDEGGKLKATGLDYWALPNVGATNEIGFNALPGGGWYTSFQEEGATARFVTSTKSNGTPIQRLYSFNHPRTFKTAQQPEAASSIRCIKIRYDQSEPQVVTGSVTSVQASTATIDAEVVDAGNASVVARGIAYSRYTDMPEVETQVG